MTFKERHEIFFMNKKGEIEYHKRCNKCQNQCKQSHKTKIVSCPQFTKIVLTKP
jgi:hypothetical protein